MKKKIPSEYSEGITIYYNISDLYYRMHIILTLDHSLFFKLFQIFFSAFIAAEMMYDISVSHGDAAVFFDVCAAYRVFNHFSGCHTTFLRLCGFFFALFFCRS